jgi:hypothetical protein
VVGLAVDVKQDDIGIPNDRSLDVPEQHGVFNLALEKLDCLFTLAVMHMSSVLK